MDPLPIKLPKYLIKNKDTLFCKICKATIPIDQDLSIVVRLHKKDPEHRRVIKEMMAKKMKLSKEQTSQLLGKRTDVVHYKGNFFEFWI